MIPLNNSIYKSYLTIEFIRKKRLDFFKNLQQLKRSQFYPTKKLIEIQTLKLKQLVKHAYDTIPYYHQIFKKNNIHPSDIQTLKDLKKIPILTKKEIKHNLHQMISTKISIKYLIKNRTGGSTGKPLIFYQCKNYLNYADAGRILAWYIIPGYNYGARTAILWSARRDIRTNQSFLYSLRKYCQGIISMNSQKITDEKLDFFIKRINQFKPIFLRGYPSSLLILAKYIEKHNKKIPNLSYLISSAEVLYDQDRKKLEEVFDCPVLNSYGSREVSQIAMECPKHNGLHIIMENQIMEILDSNEDVSPNEIGSVIITNLNNYGMPFIRYKIEDLARRSTIDKCECKRGLLLVDHITGRKFNRILTPNGSYIGAEYFFYKLNCVPGIEEFQIIQDKIDKIVILVVGDYNIINKNMENVRKQMMNEINENIQISIKYVDEIKSSETGKYQKLISKVH